jgi:hypothetical protein
LDPLAVKRRETDLHEPIRRHLERLGFEVQGEVGRCDIVARKGEDLVVVEMKLGATMDLLIQATDRQRITDSVYVAVPGPIDLGRRSRWRGIQRVLRQLELGLILVTFDDDDASREPRVEVAQHPLPYDRKKLSRRRRAVIREMDGRSESYNRGGSTQKKLMTAYRENAVRIASLLVREGPMAPRSLRELGTGEKTQSILSSNHYGWFERIERGVYDVSARGREALGEYADLVGKLTRAKD